MAHTKIQKITCAILGHSDIESVFFGYHHCGRCGEQLGDSLGGYYMNNKAVVIGHNCQVCRDNYKKLTWKDKLFTPNPFKEE